MKLMKLKKNQKLKIGKLVWHEDPSNSRYLLETVFEDEPDTIYYSERNDFIGNKDSPTVKTAEFDSWELEHKVLAKKFLENIPPKLKRKNSIDEKSVGKILSSGRSQSK